MLYVNANCRRTSFPLNSGGSGGKGTDALMPATAARSSASAPDGIAITNFGTVPFFSTMNCNCTLPRRPILALDRLWTHPGHMLKELGAHRSALAAVASDHLPLVATLEI